jgi:hypothetical protein
MKEYMRQLFRPMPSPEAFAVGTAVAIALMLLHCTA